MAQCPVVQRVLAYSVCVADKASSIVRSVLNTGQLGVVEKQGANDLQTEADRCAQRCIVKNISDRFPRLTVIGEEDLPVGPIPDEWRVASTNQQAEQLTCPAQWCDVTEDEVVVWVDPLDGTKEFTQGLLSHVTILVGVAARGMVAAGVVSQPFFNHNTDLATSESSSAAATAVGRSLFALVGTGSVLGGLQCCPLAAPGETSGGVITTTRSHSTGLVQDTVQAMQPQQVLPVGGAGHKVLLLLEGAAHAYVFPTPGCKKWDTCAPEALLVTLGGKLTDVHGAPLSYAANVAHMNSAGVLATAPRVSHDWYVRHVPAHVRQQLQ